jgi:hypothetical protein
MIRDDIGKIIAESLAIEAEDAKKAGKIGYMARALVQATLPHKAHRSNEFKRCNGKFELSIWSPNGLPYGSIPRLLLSWVTTEAVFTKSPTLELGPTLSAFMAELGLARTGGARGDITRFRNQTKRLFSSSVYCLYSDQTTDQGKGFTIATDYSLWWSPKVPNQLPLWKSKVTLGAEFFNEIIKRPVPVDMLALKLLKRSPMALDIYFWLTYRMSYLQKDTVIPWPLLQMQFGADYATDGQGPRDFKKKFLARLKQVLTVYDTAKVAPVEVGLLLKPSSPHIAKIPVPMLDGKRRGVETPSAPELLAPRIGASDLYLRTDTYEKAREVAPRLDIYYLEGAWREWVAKTGELPKDPDKAFIGFCRHKAKQHI